MSTDLEERVVEEFDRHRSRAIELSHRIGDHPEVAHEEHVTAARLAEVLESDGRFTVRRGLAGLDTAVSASAGRGALAVGLCAELDALPGIGHACAHNVITAASVAAALTLASFTDELDLTVRLLGTPAEEVLTGKTSMLRGGAFDGLHAAAMMHPTLKDMAMPRIRAVRHWSVSYQGRTAHASRPWNALNASDAAVVAQVATGLLRQQLPDADRVHVWLRGAGSAVNIVPGDATLECMIRADSLDEVDRLWPRVRACFDAGAVAAGVRMETEQLASAEGFRHDTELAGLFREHAEALGRTFPDYPDQHIGSTDMSEVSMVMPAIHPVLSFRAPAEEGNHTAAFARHARGPEGDRAVHDGGLALALTLADAARRPEVRQRLLGAGPFVWPGPRPISTAGSDTPSW